MCIRDRCTAPHRNSGDLWPQPCNPWTRGHAARRPHEHARTSSRTSSIFALPMTRMTRGRTSPHPVTLQSSPRAS
eukprot:3637122-Prymnesium_polylepis.1